MSNRLGGKQGTAYLGTNANQPPNWSFNERDPDAYDTQNVSVGDLWLNEPALRAWVLVSLQGNSTSKGALATWIQWGGGTGNGILFITGNTGGMIPGDIMANINVVGSGPYVFSGDIPSNTLTLGDDGSIATTYDTDSGSAVPIANVLTIAGSDHIATSGAGGTVSLDLFGFTEHAMVVGDAAGDLQSLAVATNGQIPIGSTGANPVVAALTAGAGITITNGAGSITIASSGGGGGSVDTLTGNSGGAVSPSGGGNINVLGDTTTITVVGNPGTNTLTASATAAVPTSFITNPATGTAIPAAHVLTFAGTGGTTVSAAGSTVTINSSATGSTTVVQTFTTSGTYTKTTGAKYIDMFIVNGGAGGGSGSCGNSGSASGGGGGCAGGALQVLLPASALNAMETVTVGGGGAGGAAVTNAVPTVGNNGSAGGISSVGNITAAGGAVAQGGRGGQLNLPGTGGTGNVWGGTLFYNAAASNGNAPQGAAGALAAGNPVTQSLAVLCMTGGAGGAGANSGTAFAGGSVTPNNLNGTAVTTISAGGIETGTINGANGVGASTPAAGFWVLGVGGGGGGGQRLGANGGTGGNGGGFGCGGGGGGGSLLNSASGAGGTGSPGYVQIIEYL